MKVSLPLALQMIYDSAKKAGPEGSVPFNRAISDMIGGVRGFPAFTALTGPHMQDFINNTKNIGTAMAASTTQVKGWDIAQSNLNIKLDQGRAMLEVLGQNVGEVLMPYVIQLLANVTPLITRFDDWFVNSGRLATVMQSVSTGVANVAGGIGTMAGVLGTIIGAFTDVGAKGQVLRAALVALGVAFAEVKIFQFAQGVVGTIGFLKDLIPAVWSTTVAFGGLDLALGPIALVIGGIALAAGAAILVFTHWDQITKGIGATFSALGTSASQTFSNMQTHITGSANEMGGSITKLQLTSTQAANQIVGDGVVAARSYGAAAKQMSDAQLQAQKTITQSAQIIPHDQSVARASLGGSGSGQPVQININIAGHNVARVLLPDLVTAIRNGLGTVGL